MSNCCMILPYGSRISKKLLWLSKTNSSLSGLVLIRLEKLMYLVTEWPKEDVIHFLVKKKEST